MSDLTDRADNTDALPLSEAEKENIRLQARVNLLEMMVAELLYHLPADARAALTTWTERMAHAADNLTHQAVPDQVREFTGDVVDAAHAMLGHIRNRVADPRRLEVPDG